MSCMNGNHLKLMPARSLCELINGYSTGIENASRNKVQQAIEAGFLTVNGKQVKSNYKIKPGDDILLMSLVNTCSTQK